MEEIQDDCQSPSDWGSLQDLASWSINDPEKGEGLDQRRTTREDLVNDLKRAGTTVSTVTISNTLHRHWLKSCSARKVPLFKPAYVLCSVCKPGQELQETSDLCNCKQRFMYHILSSIFLLYQILISCNKMENNYKKIIQCYFLDFFFYSFSYSWCTYDENDRYLLSL